MYAMSLNITNNAIHSEEYIKMTKDLEVFGFQLDKPTNLFLLKEGDLTNVYKAIEYLSSLKWLKPVLSDVHVMKIESYSDFTEIVRERKKIKCESM